MIFVLFFSLIIYFVPLAGHHHWPAGRLPLWDWPAKTQLCYHQAADASGQHGEGRRQKWCYHFFKVKMSAGLGQHGSVVEKIHDTHPVSLREPELRSTAKNRIKDEPPGVWNLSHYSGGKWGGGTTQSTKDVFIIKSIITRFSSMSTIPGWAFFCMEYYISGVVVCYGFLLTKTYRFSWSFKHNKSVNQLLVSFGLSR